MLIHQLTKDDFNLLGDFFTSLSEKTVYYFHPYKMDRENAKRVAGEIGRGELTAFGAFTEEAPQKLAGYIYADNGEFAHLGFCVRDGFQDKGTGQELMKQIIGFCKAGGRKGISLEVYKDNPRAIHIYEKYGFQVCGETEDKVQHRMLLKF